MSIAELKNLREKYEFKGAYKGDIYAYFNEINSRALRLEINEVICDSRGLCMEKAGRVKRLQPNEVQLIMAKLL